jgi:PST family polysaccharide transporter
VLAGLSVEYYPRLTAAIERKEDPNRVVNDQVELQLLLGGPAFLLIIGTAPWLMPFLFSSEFSQAAGVLRWQVLADVLWLSIWPVAFLLMALGRAELLMFAQGAGYLVTASMTAVLIPVFGVVAAAVASLLGYSLFVIVLLWAARSLTRFGLNRRNSASIAVLFLLCALVAGLGLYSTVAALAVAAVGSAVLAAYAYRRLSALLDLPARSAPLTLVRTLFKR